MYSQVPPPEQLCSEPATSPDTPQQDTEDYSKPDHVSNNHWKVGS